MRKLLWMALAVLVSGVSASAQGAGLNGEVIRPTATIAGASIRVCTTAASGTPCSPLASIFSDSALAVPIAGSIVTADAQGNYQYYALPGCYKEQISALGFSTYTRTVCGAGDALLSGNNAFTGNISIAGTASLNGGGALVGTFGGNHTLTGSVAAGTLNAVLWAGPGATPTCDAQVAALGSNPGTIMISSTYSGAECAGLSFNAVDGANYNIYRGSNNITIHDLRASTNKAYGVNYGGTTLASLARFAVTQSITSPSTTTSAILGTNQVTGNLSAGGGAMASGTFEVDTEGALTGISGNIVQALTGQWAVRSTGQTLPLVVGVEGGGGIDRNAGAGGTNITAAGGVQGDAVTTNLGTGTIQDTFGLRGFQSTVGTRNNFAIVSEGDLMFKDNSCIYGENGSNPALKLACFGIDNNATGGGNIYSTTNSPAAWKYIVNGGHKNWMAGPQINASDCFEITPSTAVNGTTFTTPTFLACPAGISIIGGISTTAPPAGNTGFQHKRVAGCATAAVLNATCDTTVTWTAAFADANYTAHCSGDVVTSGVPIVEGIDISAAKTGADIRVRTLAITAAAAQFTTLDCTAVHD